MGPPAQRYPPSPPPPLPPSPPQGLGGGIVRFSPNMTLFPWATPQLCSMSVFGVDPARTPSIRFTITRLNPNETDPLYSSPVSFQRSLFSSRLDLLSSPCSTIQFRAAVFLDNGGRSVPYGCEPSPHHMSTDLLLISAQLTSVHVTPSLSHPQLSKTFMGLEESMSNFEVLDCPIILLDTFGVDPSPNDDVWKMTYAVFLEPPVPSLFLSLLTRF